MQIVTGYKGEAHITAWQDRDVNQGAFGNGNYILGVGSKMAATVVNANTIRIADGALCMNGCVAVIQKGSYDSVAIDSGSQGMLRRDLIVARYTRNASTGVENIALAVIKGTPTSGTPTTPSYTEGDIQSGDFFVEFPLYRVDLSGINVTVRRMADILMTGEEILASNALLNALNAQFSVWSSRLTTVENQIDDLIITRSYTSEQFTIAAGGRVELSANQFGAVTPAGYTPLGVLSYSNSASRNVIPYQITPQNTGTSAMVMLVNVGTSSVTATFTIRVNYIRTEAHG